MKKEVFSNTIEKHGFLTGEPHFHEGGISSKTNKPYGAFAYIYYLPLNREQTSRLDIEVSAFAKIEEATADMEQCTRIVISGQEDANGRFLAWDVREYEAEV